MDKIDLQLVGLLQTPCLAVAAVLAAVKVATFLLLEFSFQFFETALGDTTVVRYGKGA